MKPPSYSEKLSIGTRRINLRLAVLLLFDQIIKYFYYHTGDFITNEGFALGFGRSFPAIIISLVVIIIFSRAHLRNPRPETALMLVGGISNLIDRFVYTFVIDYINLFGIWFNLADVYIMIGFLVFIFKELKK